MTARPQTRPAPRREVDELTKSYFFQQWETADRHVPFPYVYWWIALPRPGRRAARLDALRRWDSSYRITNEFSIHLSGQDGVFAPGVLRRENYSFRLMPVQGRQGLLTPEGAEQILERHLERQHAGFWQMFLREIDERHVAVKIEKCLEHYRRVDWHSLRFEQPFAAGVIEPFYKFRKVRSRSEFWVGARTGRIRHEPASD